MNCQQQFRLKWSYLEGRSAASLIQTWFPGFSCADSESSGHRIELWSTGLKSVERVKVIRRFPAPLSAPFRPFRRYVCVCVCVLLRCSKREVSPSLPSSSPPEMNSSREQRRKRRRSDGGKRGREMSWGWVRVCHLSLRRQPGRGEALRGAGRVTGRVKKIK